MLKGHLKDTKCLSGYFRNNQMCLVTAQKPVTCKYVPFPKSRIMECADAGAGREDLLSFTLAKSGGPWNLWNEILGAAQLWQLALS